MKAALLGVAALLAAAVPAAAADHDGHAGHGAASEAAPFGSPVADEHVWYHALLEQFEGRLGADDGFHWEGTAWAGTDTNRIRFNAEGALDGAGRAEEGRYELLYERPITSFFNLQGGIRTDADAHAGRSWAAFGVEGLAPLFWHVAATGYAGSQGHLAARLEASYDLLLTQRLILQPQLEMNFYSKADPRRAIGSGLSRLDAGLRLRYEITRKFAPYIGLAHEEAFGETAVIARKAGGRSSALRFTIGIRSWL